MGGKAQAARKSGRRNRKHGRNVDACKLYASTGRYRKNKIRRLKRHLRMRSRSKDRSSNGKRTRNRHTNDRAAMSALKRWEATPY